MLKRFTSILVALVLFFCFIVSVPVYASIDYQDKSTFSNVRFTFGSVPETVYNYDYWVLYVSPYSYSDTSKYSFGLYLIADNSYENFGSVEGSLYFYTDTYPYNTKLNAVYSGNPGVAIDYEQSTEYPNANSSYISFTDSSVSLRGWTGSFPSSYVGGWVFDNYNLDKFPTYQGSTSNYTSKMILASNVDMYDQYGNLLQYGNYYTLLQYFGGTLDSSKITDYSGHETAPGVVVEPTTSSSSGGTSGGDSQTSKDQLETSKGIWGTVKDVFNKLVEIAGNIISLPFDIAVAVGQILRDALESLKNDILDGLKSLFVPSDNLFNDMRYLLEEKFKFVNQIIELIFDFSAVTWIDSVPPESNVTLYGVTVSFMNWEFYDDYRDIINTITIIVSYYWFVKRLIRKMPKLIGGLS